MTLTAGSRLGPYEILAPLGTGGMGEVYRARDERLERTVAVKVLPSDVSSSPEQRQRFEREAKTISQLSRPFATLLPHWALPRAQDSERIAVLTRVS